MLTVNSLSGGKTSSYIAAHYPADYDIFALVRIEDESCKFPDPKIRQLVEDRIQQPFIGTSEDDVIIYTMLDLEQYIGRPIKWVTGDTFDQVLKTAGGWLPNKLHRYCTSNLKIQPMFNWWLETKGEPVEMRIGYRANEKNRRQTMIEKMNAEGLISFEATIEKHETGRHKGLNKWEFIPWQKPVFPLIDAVIYKDTIESYWSDNNIPFALLNNCVGCFHRNPLLLRKMWDVQPLKMNWFAVQETKENKGRWRSDTTYFKIKEHYKQLELSFGDFSECDSGYCEVN